MIGGPGAFVEPIDDFKSFGDAMVRKLVKEIAWGPWPVADRRMNSPLLSCKG